MTRSVLVNATTLVVGGGIQVGVSFIEYASAQRLENLDFVFAVSRPIYESLSGDLQRDRRVHVTDVSPSRVVRGRQARSLLNRLELELRPDVIYSLGFPSYVRFETPEVGRYTNPWEILPNRLAWSSVPVKERAALFLRTQYRLMWARRAAYFETQTEAARRGIARQLSVPPQRINVIPNSPNLRFLRSGDAAEAAPAAGPRRILCLSAPYRHKNLQIIPKVAEQLRRRHNASEYLFVLTLPHDSPLYREIQSASLASAVADMIENVGPRSMDECVVQYQQADVVFLPTLLEVFSVTYVEAMAMSRPIVTSDLDFARDVCGTAALYYNPVSAGGAAAALAAVVEDPALRADLVRRGIARLAQFPGPDEKHRMVLDWLRQIAERERDRQDGRWRSSRRLIAHGPTPGHPATHDSISLREYRICVNCVMDTTDSAIRFDAHGFCDHCTTFYRDVLPNWHTAERGRRQLVTLVARIRRAGSGRDYDCILGVSGGIDSSYLTYIATTELGLRPLVFHVDAGWNSQEAVNNIERLVDKLGLDLYTEVIDWQEMRDLQLAFFKAGVPHIDTPQDHAFFSMMYKFAEEHGVKYILTGANYSTECIRNPIEWMYYQSDSVQLLDIHRRFGTRPLVTFPTTSILSHKVYLQFIKGIKVVKLLNYIPYRKQEAIEILVDKFGWQPYVQKHFESRFTKFYEGYWLPKKFGYDVRRVQYSSLILTNQMTREDALEKLKSPPYDDLTIAQEFEYVASKLNISVEELRGYMDAPNKTHRDYKCQESIYALGAAVMRFFALELGGKR